EKAHKLVRPRVLYRTAPCELEPGEVRLGELAIGSAKVAQTLFKAHTGVVFLATLGEEYDTAVEALQAEGDTFTAYLLEAYAAAGVYALLGRFRERLRRRGGVSRHYCPGYEGWPLEENERLFRFLDASNWGFT